MDKKCTGRLSCPTQIPFGRALHTFCCEGRLGVAHNNLLLWRTAFRQQKPPHPDYITAPPPSNRQWPMTHSGVQRWDVKGGLIPRYNLCTTHPHGQGYRQTSSRDRILTEFCSPVLPGSLHSPSSKTISMSLLHRSLRCRLCF